MNIIYYSLTGNVRRFITKAETEATDMMEVDSVNEPFIIVTSTIGFGEIPVPVEQFLDEHRQYLTAVVSSGNRNWGQNFAKAGDRISEKYGVPLLMKFELHGNMRDVTIFKEKVDGLSEDYKREKIQSY